MNMRSGRNVTLAICCLIAAVAGTTKEIKDGKSVVTAMRERYQESWYATMTFTQKSTTYNADGTTKVETWYEAGNLPGKLRIDFGPPSEGNGAILAHGKGFFFEKGKQTSSRPMINLLLVLGFDVYRQKPEETLALLEQEGIDVSKFHEDEWKGEPVYVVGAEKDDLKSTQFWVEKKRLLFVRLIQPDRHDEKKKDDVRFADYRKMPKGFIAARVEVYNNEKLVFTEEYSKIQTDIELEPGVFDPAQFSTARWKK